MSGRTFPESSPRPNMTSTTRSERSISTVDLLQRPIFRVGRAFQGKHVALRPTTLTESGMSSFRYNPSATLISLRPMSSKIV